MLGKIFNELKKFDWILFAAVLLLLCFGLLEVYGIALSHGDWSIINYKKQVFFIFAGIACLFLFSFIDYHHWRNLSNYLYILGVLALVGVLFFGETIRGTRGWYNFFGFTIQPVEFVKFILIVFLARYFSSVSIKINPLKHILISGAGTFLLIFLVLRQPDFGSAILLFGIWIFMIVLTGYKKKYILLICFLIAVIFCTSWLFLFKDYQKQRIMTFLNPSFDPLNQGYNITQAIIAVGSGGLTGRGVGFGSQTQLKFLPEAQNDFIFAVIAEELGLLGVTIVLILFAIIFFRLLISIKHINNDFGIFYMLGVVVLIFMEMFINIGMNIGLLPVVGISLPLLSYGGSALISTMIMIGVAESIIIRSKIRMNIKY